MACRYQSVMAAFQQGRYQSIFGNTHLPSIYIYFIYIPINLPHGQQICSTVQNLKIQAKLFKLSKKN